MRNLPYHLEKIICVANDLANVGLTGGCTSEIIAAAFVLNRMEFIPHGYTVVEAWERLGDEWQGYVKEILQKYSDLLVPW